MKFSAGIDDYLRDRRALGYINSDRTERDYRIVLTAHADDVQNRDPGKTSKEDVKRTLRRWSRPNSRSKNHSIIISFYDWAVQGDLRASNPARAVERAKRRPAKRVRLTRAETLAVLRAASGKIEERAIILALCTGLRRAELLGLQGRDFARDGLIEVRSGKGGKYRTVPVPAELRPLTREIRRELESDDYVLPAQRWRNPGTNTDKIANRKRPMSEGALWQLVVRVGQRAGVAPRVTPHVLRRAYAEYVAKRAGLLNTKAMLGHESVATTQIYVGEPTLDELQASVADFTWGWTPEQTFYPRVAEAAKAVEAPTRIELV
jgi:integrase